MLRCTATQLALSGASRQRQTTRSSSPTKVASPLLSAYSRLAAKERKRLRQEAVGGSVPLAHAGGISGLLYSPHGRHLLTSGADGRLRSWHPQTCHMQIVNYGVFPQTSQSNYRRVQFAASWNANLVAHLNISVCDIL